MPDKLGGPACPTANALFCLRPLAHDVVTLDPSGWLGAWHDRNAATTISHVLDRLESGEAWSNLARLVNESDAPVSGMVFSDSDIYKALEAVAWAASAWGPDHPTIRRAQRFVDLLERVQADDGYLNTYVQGSPDAERYSDPQWGHELYCAGHLFQAAVAASRTGALPGLVGVATRLADHLVQRFGAGTSPYLEGHPEVETALVELYRVTGSSAYLALAARQLDQRGHGQLGGDRFGASYFQDHVPLRDGPPATGHAVRQLYLLTGGVDVAVETGDRGLLDAVVRVWEDLVATKTYVTGGHGSRHRDEAIGDPYELPADRAYAETCAAIASFQLNWRLLLATGQARYAQEMETALYNAVAVSTSLAGTAFFYSNPLHLRTGHLEDQEDAPSGRQPWYTCACCPPNLARLLASVHDYLATTTDEGVQIHHYATGHLATTVDDVGVDITMSTAYPYDGDVVLVLDVATASEWELSLRIPAWCREVTVEVDGVRLATDLDGPHPDGYVRLRRTWTGSHRVRLGLDMPVRLIAAHDRVDAVRGCRAVARGPLLFAIEDVDLPAGVVLEDLRLIHVGAVRRGAEPVPITVDLTLDHVPADAAALYGEMGIRPAGQTVLVPALPYHRWGNRAPGAMRVWLPTAEPR